MTDYPEIMGVYSLRKADEIGMGSTATSRSQLTYWYVRRMAPDVYDVQPLNVNHVPSGIHKEVNEVELLTQYTPEPSYYKIHTVPALEALKKKIDQGFELFSSGKLDEAERAFIKALSIDDHNVDANYGLGDVYVEKKEFSKLRKVLETLVGMDEAFRQEHRERFNDFGIRLRKGGRLDDSVIFYGRALELNAMDEHVYFNLARALFDKGDQAGCMQNLNIALTINPAFTEAQEFLKYCSRVASAQAAG